MAFLEPTAALRKVELKMDFTQRLVSLEEMKSLPWTAVWDYYCVQKGVPVGGAWFDEVRQYERGCPLQAPVNQAPLTKPHEHARSSCR